MALPKDFISPQDYLKFERASDTKHEYYAGEIFAMTGASRKHNQIMINTGASLNGQLRKRPCFVFPSDMRVRTRTNVLYAYPDISVVCGTPEFEDGEVDTLLNSTVIIEVLSPSAECCDRGRKFQHYRTLDSLQEDVLIAQVEFDDERGEQA